MALSERKISVVPSAGSSGTMEARLARLEGEARQLRAEIAELEEEFRWLGGEEPEGGGDPAFISRGWLARGWVRASLLLAAVGFVAFVSVPYLFHLLDPPGRPADPTPAAPARSLSPVAPAPAPAVDRVAPPERIPAPERVRAAVPEPARGLREEPRPSAPPRPAVLPDAGGPGAAEAPAPVRGQSP